MFRTLVCAALVTLALAAGAHAQPSGTRVGAQPTGQISGQVRYADTKQPAFNVLVSCDALQGGLVGQVQTDRSGRFTFSGLAPAQFNIRVHAPGYLEEQQTVELQTTSFANLQIQLRPDPSFVAGAPASGAEVDVKVPPAAQKEFEQGRALVLGDARDEKKLGEGLSHLEKAVQLYPKYLEAQLLLGTGYMDARQWDKAEQALRRALEINPKATTASIALGDVLRRKKKYDEAEKVLTEALKLNDKSAQAHFTLGEVYWEKNDIPKAGVQVGTALQLKPDYAEAHLLAGNLLLRARKAEEALTEFQEYLRLAPDGEFAQQARDISKKIQDALAKKP